ncbi:MAG: hypothetical protein IJR22_03395 [Acidaminococcaceae bacterium]|nr:hypothetical protein [Acidaminococcaceae bacterium]
MEHKSYYPKTRLIEYVVKIAELVFGLFLFAAGAYLMVQANIGLSSWWALDIGISNLTGIDYGTVHNAVALVVLLIDILVKEKIGWGMVADALLIGTFVMFFNQFHLVPLFQTMSGGVTCIVAGLLLCGIGSYYYMDAGFGCGPRDALMVAICRHYPHVPVGVARFFLEGSALLTGWALGAKIGIGTVIATVGMGVAIQFVFRFFRFDATRVYNENVLETCQAIHGLMKH